MTGDAAPWAAGGGRGAPAALLHDVVEDTLAILAGLRAQGYPAAVLEIVRLAPRDKTTQTCRQYIDTVAASGNRSAMRVKFADLNGNSSLARMQGLPPDLRGIIHRYRGSMARIEAELPAPARSVLWICSQIGMQLRIAGACAQRTCKRRCASGGARPGQMDRACQRRQA